MTMLLIFLELMEHRKAATVAESLGMTPSAVSHALARLREVFQDDLFLRRPHGFEPTDHARRIEPEVRAGLTRIDRSLTGGAAFDPALASQTLRLSALDYEVATLVPGFLSSLAAEAPGVRVVIQSDRSDRTLADLAAHRTDLAVGYFWDLPDECIATPLAEESYLVVARAGHPVLADGCTLESYLDCAHLVVSPRGQLHGIVDKTLRAQGLTRRVVVSVPQFFPALAIAQQTDLVLALPARMARAYAGAFGLQVHAPPLALRSFTISAVRHRRDEKNPLLVWSSGLLARVAKADPSP